MNTVAHRRQYPRYKTDFSAKYTLKEGKFRDIIQDIGAGGVYFNTRRRIQPGRSINIQIPIFAFGRPVSVMGTVVRTEDDGFAVAFDWALEARLFNDGDFPRSAREVSLQPDVD